MLGDNPTQDVLRYGKDKENRKNFIHDNLLLVKFNDVLFRKPSLPILKTRIKKVIINSIIVLMVLLKGFK